MYVFSIVRSILSERKRERDYWRFLLYLKKKTHGKFLSDAILSYINNRKNYDKMQF